MAFNMVVKMIVDADPQSPQWEAAWKVLFLMPRWLLMEPKQPKKNRPPAVIRQRLQWFLAGNWARLHEESSSLVPDYSKRKAASDAESRQRKIYMAQQLCRQGELSRANGLLSSASRVLDANADDVIRKVHDYFPQRDAPQLGQSDQAEPTAFEPEEILRVLRRAARGTGSGISGWRVDHFAALVTFDVCASVASVASMLLDGRIPRGLVPFITAGALTPLSKSDGGLRPIVVVEALVRIVGKAVVGREQAILARSLSPHQYGVNVPAGMQSIVHAVRLHHRLEGTWSTMLIDFSNAYGTISRDAIWQQLRSHPEAVLTSRYFRFLYAGPNTVIARGAARSTIHTGIVQGDPLGPLFFSMGLDPVLTASQRDGVHAYAYLDDVTMCGPSDKVLESFTALQQNAAEIGLMVNRHKCKVLCHGPTVSDPLLTTNLPMTSEGVTLLGAAVGIPQWEKEQVARMVDKMVADAACIECIPTLQLRLLLLRYCVSNAAAHLTRVTTPTALHDAVGRCDQKVTELLAGIMSAPVTEVAKVRQQVALPVSQGGLGLALLQEVHDLDYLAAAVECYRLLRDRLPRLRVSLDTWFSETCGLDIAVEIRAAVGHLKDTNPQGVDAGLLQSVRTLAEAECAARGLQKTLRGWHNRCAGIHVMTSATEPQTKLRLISRSCPGALAFVAAIPSDPQLAMSNDELATALCLLYGVPISSRFGITDQSLCVCAGLGDAQYATDIHLGMCHAYGHAIHRHDAVRDVFVKMLRSLKETVKVEQLFEHSSHRMDIVVGSRFFDVAVTDPLAMLSHVASSLPMTSYTPLHRAEEMVRVKVAKYVTSGLIPRESGIEFIPLVFETFGAMHSNVHQLLRQCDHKAYGQPPEGATWAAPTFAMYWLQALSVTLHRMTARGVNHIAGKVQEQDAAAYGFPGGLDAIR
jgi:hypothetical protein